MGLGYENREGFLRHFLKTSILAALFCASAGQAQTSSSPMKGSSSLELPGRLLRQKPKRFSGSLTLTGTHYLTEKRTPSESENYGFLSGELRYKNKKGGFDWAADAVAEVSADQAREAYYGVPELFARLTDDDSGVRVTVGRQKRSWSELDQKFHLGIWQPQLRWDYLNPIQQGLTGVFLDTDFQPLHVTLFASPVFIPDQGPQFRMEDGRFVSENRWFWKPQTHLRLGEESSNLFYEMNTPRVEDIVMNPSLGGMMRVDPEGPLALQLAYAYKPMNQFFIGYECSQCVDLATLDGTARIHPMVVNHHVFTSEVSWTRTQDRFLFSWTVDRPNDPKIPQDWGGSDLRPVYIPGVSYERKGEILYRPVRFGVGYFQEIKGSRIVTGELGGEVESSADRYSFQDLLGFSGQVNFYSSLLRSFDLSTRYAYSFKEDGGWLNVKLVYRVGSLETSFGFDLLGSRTDPLSANAGLFSRYRSNDRVYAGVGFVF